MRWLILHEQDLLAKGFLPPNLSTSILFICFWIDLVRVFFFFYYYYSYSYFFRALSSILWFQSNQRFQAIEFVDRFQKALNLTFPKLSSQNMRGLDHATILSPSFHGLRNARLAQWPLFVS